MTNFYPEKPVVPYARTTVPMADVISYIQANDCDPEVKRAAYILFRVESSNGQSGICQNYVGCQCDSGRWPAKFDPLIVGVVQTTENGTGRTRLFAAFDRWQSCVDFLLDRVQGRGLYIGAMAVPISHLQIGSEADLVRAYVKEWAQGSRDAEPDANTIAAWRSMYGQAAALFRHSAPTPSPLTGASS